MSHAAVDLVFEQGIPFDEGTMGFRYLAGTPPQPVDLSGWTAEMDIRDNLRGPSKLRLSTENGGLVLGSGGEVYVRLTAVQVDALNLIGNRGVYDIKLFDPDGIPDRLIGGKVKVDPAVTRD